MEVNPVMTLSSSDGTEVQLSASAVNELHQQQQAQQQQMLTGSHGLISHTGIPVVQNHQTATMTFTDSNKSWDMLQFHRKARDHEKYCDAVLHVQGRQFLCHRLILASNSPYFDSIFQSRIANASASGLKAKNSQYYSRNPANATRSVLMESLIISCTEPEVFQTFLNYMYTGQVTVDKSNVAELLRLSNNFMVSKLKEYCAEYLDRFLDAENCLQVKEVGEKYGIPGLAKSATTFVQNNLGEVINHEIMMELLPKQVENFFTEKAWSIPPEASVKFMSRWVCHDLPNRERDFKQLLTNVDWNMIDPNVIVDYIDQEPLYGSSERCFYYVLHSLADKGIQVQKYEQMYQALQQRFGQEIDQPLGYGENLLQMAFNSAMEGLQVPPESSWSDGRDNNKWNNENDPNVAKPKKEVTLEQKRKRILRRIQRNRAIKRWVVVRLDRPRSKKLGVNEIAADSSGDEECDPVQTQDGYHCHLCPFNSKKISRLERHLACIHAHDVTYRCSECGFTCKWNREYFLHMKGHFEGPPYKCESLNCEFTANKIGSLIGHRISHLDLKPYHCTECEFKSRTKANLAVHVKIHNNEKPYRCGICGRNFASKNSLDQHAVGHNTDKTYSCTQCPFSTKYLNHFTNHKKTHHIQTGKKKGKELYRCSDTQCKYTTSKKSQLESHMRSHAGVRPHVCGICGRRFLEKSHLVRHERIHFNERPFKCEECDYASTRRDKLKEHKTRHHGANASAKSPYKPRPHKTKGSAGSGGSQSNSNDQTVVYAKKSSVPAQQQAQQQQGGVQQVQQTQVQGQETVGAGNEMEFIIPHGTPIATSEGGGQTFTQLTQSQTMDLQQMANAGIVQLRQYQPGKPSETIQVAQTLASFPGTISAQELQRTLGIKFEDLQAQGIIGIQTGVTGGGGQTRTIKLEELTGALGQSISAQGLVTQGGQGQVSRGPATMVLDAAQLQQLAAVAAQSGSFERGIPITISSVQVPSSVSSNVGNTQQVQVATQNVQQVQQQPQGQVQVQNQNQSVVPGGQQQQQQQQNQTNDFSGLSNLFC